MFLSAIPSRSEIAGLVLAGGKSRRMGVDKCLLRLAGRPLIAHAAERLRPQVGQLALNANGDPRRLVEFGLPVIADLANGAEGPLAGLLAGMHWARASGQPAKWIATVATDTPFFPDDLVSRLATASADPRTVRVAASRGGVHPVFGLWPIALAEELEAWLAAGRSWSVRDWISVNSSVTVEFDDRGAVDPFFNANTPEDLAVAHALLDKTEP